MSEPSARPRHTLSRAFACALSGAWTLVRRERNVRIQLVCAAIAIGLGAYVRLAAIEWVAITFCITLVLACEALNSAIEKAVDHTSLAEHPLAKQAKDFAAAGVLIAATGSAVIGAIVFLPKLI